VGHTHEDIDQMCSCVSRKLLKKSALTIEDLGRVIQESYSPSPEVATVDYLPDVKAWMHPVVDDLSGHSEPHQFKIEADVNGWIRVYFRKWSTSKSWKAVTPKGSDEPIALFASLPAESIPSYVPINFEQVLLSMKSDIPKYGCLFSNESKEWWETFIGKTEQRQEKGAPDRPWLLDQLRECRKDSNTPPPSLLTEQDTKMHEELEKRFSKERKDPKVS